MDARKGAGSFHKGMEARKSSVGQECFLQSVYLFYLISLDLAKEGEEEGHEVK
jgi:hypothetical protein